MRANIGRCCKISLVVCLLARYAAKYVAKSGQIEILLNDVIDSVQRKAETQIIRPNVKQVLSQLLLADCSHRTYMTKQELAYKVLDLPQVCDAIFSPPMQCMQCTMHKMGPSYEHVHSSVCLPRFVL